MAARDLTVWGMSARGMKTRTPTVRDEGHLPQLCVTQREVNMTEWTIRAEAVSRLSPCDLDESKLWHK